MSTKKQLRLDAFLSETNTLFILLIVAVTMQATILGNILALLFGMDDPLASMDFLTQDYELVLAFLPIICLSGLAIAVVFGMAFYFYRQHPGEIRLQKRLAPITDKDKKLREQFDQLAQRAGITPPQIEMNPQGFNGSGGQVFGFTPDYSVCLDGGLRIWKITKPDMFNAVVLHEFGHIVNQDVAISYLSYGIWKATLIFMVVPFVLGISGILLKSIFVGILQGDLIGRLMTSIPISVGLFFQAGFMMGVTAVIWARLLRVREYYADWQAVLWGAGEGLRQIFREMVEQENKSQSKLALFRFHPTAEERVDASNHPEILFRASKTVSFLTGVLISFLLAGFFYTGFSTFLLFQEIIQLSSYPFVWFMVFAAFVIIFLLPLAMLISGTLGVQIQKQSMLDLSNNQRGSIAYLKLMPLAFFFALGIEAGFWGAPFDLLAPKSLSAGLFELFVSFPVLVLAGWLYFTFVRYISMRVYGRHVGKTGSLHRRWFIGVSSTTWLFFFFVPNLALGQLITETNFQDVLMLYLGILIGGLLLIPVFLGGNWLMVKWFFGHPPVCQHCGKVTQRSMPVRDDCEYCEKTLGEWLFVS